MDLSTLLRGGGLPDAALRAAAVHPDLTDALAAAPSLPDDLFLDLWDGAGAAETVALALVHHVDRAARRHHVLAVRGETRPAVLAALLATVVPTRGWRRRNAHRLVGPVADAVLGNVRWPLDEQAEVVGRASPEAVLRWAASADPDTAETQVAHEVLHRRAAEPASAPAAGLRPHVIREAVLRWPETARLALAIPSCRAWGAVAAVTDDANVLAPLVRQAARTVDPIDGAPLLEALWCNPWLPTDLRRRLLQILVAGRVRHYYVRPTPELPRRQLAEPPSRSHERADTLLLWAERATDVRHLTAWSVATLLAGDDDLRPEQVAHGFDLLDRDGVAAGVPRRTVAWLHERRGLPVVDAPQPDRRPVGSPASAGSRVDPAAGHLAALLGDDQEAWDVAVAMLRDGWNDTATRLARTAQAVVAPRPVRTEACDVA